MKNCLHINALVKFTLPTAPGRVTPVVVDAKVCAVYQESFHGIAGSEAKPAKALDDRKGEAISSWVDLETLDGTLYKYVPHAQSFEGFKCWHWAWPVQGQTAPRSPETAPSKPATKSKSK